MSNYEIRKFKDGTIFRNDVKDLVDFCIDNRVLAGIKNDWVLIYRLSSEMNPEQFPEGWYMEDYEKVINDLMNDERGIS